MGLGSRFSLTRLPTQQGALNSKVKNTSYEVGPLPQKLDISSVRDLENFKEISSLLLTGAVLGKIDLAAGLLFRVL